MTPNYQIKLSKRAQRMRLQVSQRGVLVVAPEGTPQALIDDFVQQKHAWIEKHQRRFAEIQQNKAPRLKNFPPDSLNLRAINQVWHFSYQNSPRDSYQEIVPGECRIEGSLSQASLQDFFHYWLGKQARLHLVPKLAAISKTAGLPYNKVFIKRQKTRWGSCSNRGNINLNYKLLFLPAPVARYVLIHELAHLRHPNHSPNFWHFVEKMEPDYRHLDQALNDVSAYIPDFLAN